MKILLGVEEGHPLVKWLRLLLGPETKHPPPCVSIDNAMVCEDCRQISASTNSHCIICGSHAIWPLAKILHTNILVDRIVEGLKGEKS